MKAFVVRPFGIKRDIDFNKVHEDLIAPALKALDIQGSTTEPFMEAGNIREDMFRQLLVADIVIADISIHNANVFYELGIRHALQPMRTFLLRASEDEVPFDLKTDRYLSYDSADPGKTLEPLKDALRQTLASDKRDSPVFQMLPDLEGQDRSRFLPVPQSFRDDVELASKSRRLGLLSLMAMEAQDFFWASEGLRLIGRAQLDLGAYREAKSSWEALLKLNPWEAEANQRLGTIYQRIGDLDASDQALQRVLSDKKVSRPERAEALSLIARNIKDRWRSSWQGLSSERGARAALESPLLLQSYEKYRQGFQENLASFYPGLNALSLLTILVDLAAKFPDVWNGNFPSDEAGDAALASLKLQCQKLTGAVGLSLDSVRADLQQTGRQDRWVDISAADYQFLTSTRPRSVAFAYREALAGARDFYFDSSRKQLELFRDLGVLTANAEAALPVLLGPGTAQPPKLAPGRVVLFTGHMIGPRFADSLRDSARDAIRAKMEQEIARTPGRVIAIASGANGGDLLFHQVCDALGVEHHLYLPLPPETFRNDSVSPAGRYWENCFDDLVKKSEQVPCLATSQELPLWLSVKKDYTAWQRANIWLIHEALALHANNFTLLSLWDGVETDGLGGTYHMQTIAEEYGAALVTIPTCNLAEHHLQG